MSEKIASFFAKLKLIFKRKPKEETGKA